MFAVADAKHLGDFGRPKRCKGDKDRQSVPERYIEMRSPRMRARNLFPRVAPKGRPGPPAPLKPDPIPPRHLLPLHPAANAHRPARQRFAQTLSPTKRKGFRLHSAPKADAHPIKTGRQPKPIDTDHFTSRRGAHGHPKARAKRKLPSSEADKTPKRLGGKRENP